MERVNALKILQAQAAQQGVRLVQVDRDLSPYRKGKVMSLRVELSRPLEKYSDLKAMVLEQSDAGVRLDYVKTQTRVLPSPIETLLMSSGHLSQRRDKVRHFVHIYFLPKPEINDAVLSEAQKIVRQGPRPHP